MKEGEIEKKERLRRGKIQSEGMTEITWKSRWKEKHTEKERKKERKKEADK